jgi:pimeloyl-ACP methyl ester carboxylesterase
MQQAIPHARLHLLADAGHLLLVEKPIELQALVVAFMNPHVSEGAPH